MYKPSNMQELLKTRLNTYLIDNNLDLFIALQQEGRVDSYLRDKVATAEDMLDRLLSDGTPAYIIEEQCLEFLTEDLRPSRFNYLLKVLEEDFEAVYQQFREAGILTYETINLIEACAPVFETMGFTSDNEEDRQLHHAITGAVKEYLDKQQ